MDPTKCPDCNSLYIPRWYMKRLSDGTVGLVAAWENEDGTYTDLTEEEMERVLNEKV